MKNIKAGDKAYYNGQPVLVLCVRRVSGGTAADVKRHADATNWPWTVDSFTTAVCNLTPHVEVWSKRDKGPTPGYALVECDSNAAFSWHPTHEDALKRQKWEEEVMGRCLRIVKDSEATWPDIWLEG
jgi:hypothetical protein